MGIWSGINGPKEKSSVVCLGKQRQEDCEKKLNIFIVNKYLSRWEEQIVWQRRETEDVLYTHFE